MLSYGSLLDFCSKNNRS